MKATILEALIEARRERRTVALLTDLDTGEQTLAARPFDALVGSALEAPVTEALATDRAKIHVADSMRIFVQPFCPAPRLVIVGAVHIAQHLSVFATRLGHQVTVIDPRSAFATAERFPDVVLRHEWPGEALDALGLDERCAVVTLSHDPKIDDPALERALASDAYYIGCLGSQRTQAQRRERLEAAGFSTSDLKRLNGPVGLDLGARSPSEIALSVAAELTQKLRQSNR